MDSWASPPQDRGKNRREAIAGTSAAGGRDRNRCTVDLRDEIDGPLTDPQQEAAAGGLDQVHGPTWFEVTVSDHANVRGRATNTSSAEPAQHPKGNHTDYTERDERKSKRTAHTGELRT
jgi:hypothetical protein